jgi:hypothetical protein
MTRSRSLIFAGVLRMLCLAGIAGAAARSESSSPDLTWQVALLGVVFAIDLVVFIGLVREELRDWRATRRIRGGEPFGEGASAPPSSSR